MNDKVVLVTVTYNSSTYLKRLIDAAVLQSEKLYRLVVVDNASNADHKTVIKRLCDAHDIIDWVELDENLGGAGGFNRGIKYAIERYPECNWIWIMDDDAFPEQDTLKKLLNYANTRGLKAVCPVIKGLEKNEYQIYHHKQETRYLNRDLPAFNNTEELKDVAQIDANSFVGPLINRTVVENIGFPDAGLFIEGDDTDYTYAISRKYGLFLIKEATVNHRDLINNSGMIDQKGIWKEYYHCRNRILFIRKYSKTNADRIRGELLYIKNTMGNTYLIFKENQYKGIRKKYCMLIWQGIIDGLRDIRGKVVDPKEYVEMCKISKAC